MKRNLLLCILGLLCGLFSMASVASGGVFPVKSAMQSGACGLAPSHTAANFCSGFKAVVACNCSAKHEPSTICSNISVMYHLMQVQYIKYGTKWLQEACEQNKGAGVTTAECMDQWKCYMTGQPNNPADGQCFGDKPC